MNLVYNNRVTKSGNVTGFQQILNDGWKEVTITISPSSTTFTKNTEIHQIEFYIYYDGADSDCITEALGSTCEVIFMVTNHKAA